MAIAQITEEQMVSIIAHGVQSLLVDKLRAEVKSFRDQIVAEIDNALEDACCKAAREVVTRVANIDGYSGPELRFQFSFKEQK